MAGPDPGDVTTRSTSLNFPEARRFDMKSATAVAENADPVILIWPPRSSNAVTQRSLGRTVAKASTSSIFCPGALVIASITSTRLRSSSGQIADLALLADLRFQQGEILLRAIDVGGEARLHARQPPPVHADPEQQGKVDDAEQPAQIEGRQAQLDSLEADLTPPTPLGCEVDSDHWDLSPGRRSASPTATARDGPAAWTSSAYPGSISMRWNGLVNSTGMPQFDDR